MSRIKYKYAWLIIPFLVTISIPITILIITISNSLYSPGAKLIIDHDGGADDAMAIFMALLAEKCDSGPRVLALTTTHGNVDEDQTYINSQIILNVARRDDVPIFRGANLSIIENVASDHYFGNDGLGDLQNMDFYAIPSIHQYAAMALIDFSNRYKGDLVILSLGALTNIALAVRLDPDFLNRIGQLYIAAGNIHSESQNEPEYNVQMDVEAYFMAVKDAIPDKVTVIHFSQVHSSMNINKEWREYVLGSIDTDIMRAQNNFERISMSKITDGVWSLLDPIAMATLLKPSVIQETKYSNNSVILCGDKRGFNTNEIVAKRDANVRLIYYLHESIYKDYLLELFSEC